jgi:hypothetical protein
MDTAFVDLNLTQALTEEAPRAFVDSLNPLPFTLIQTPIKEPNAADPSPIPDRILVRQIGLVEGPDGPFGYIAPDVAWPYSDAALDRILDGLRCGYYERGAPAEPFNRPLDVSCCANTLFVFFLSDQRNWRFTRNAKAITLGCDDAGDRDNYYKLRHVVDDSVGTPDSPSHADCKIAYFVARKSSDRFAHKFNLNIELVYQPDCEGANTMPIVIDPDVRFPGGSGHE